MEPITSAIVIASIAAVAKSFLSTTRSLFYDNKTKNMRIKLDNEQVINLEDLEDLDAEEVTKILLEIQEKQVNSSQENSNSL